MGLVWLPTPRTSQQTGQAEEILWKSLGRAGKKQQGEILPEHSQKNP